MTKSKTTERKGFTKKQMISMLQIMKDETNHKLRLLDEIEVLKWEVKILTFILKTKEEKDGRSCKENLN